MLGFLLKGSNGPIVPLSEDIEELVIVITRTWLNFPARQVRNPVYCSPYKLSRIYCVILHELSNAALLKLQQTHEDLFAAYECKCRVEYSEL